MGFRIGLYGRLPGSCLIATMAVVGCARSSDLDNAQQLESRPRADSVPADIAFDSASWKIQRTCPTNRRAMLSDLTRNRKLHGMHFAEIVDLMGLPEEVYTDLHVPEVKNGMALHFYLERYSTEADRQRLVILVDDNLVVTTVRRGGAIMGER